MAVHEIMEGKTRRALSDEEAKTFFPPQVTLTADKTAVSADGLDFVTVSVQLKSVPLSDDSQANLAIVHPVVLVIAETEIRLETDANGRASHEFDFDTAGVYVIGVQHLNHNSLTIQAV